MSVQGPSAIETWRVQEYSSNVQMLLQRGSVLAPYVATGTHTGKQASPVDQIGRVYAQERLARNVESEIQDIDYDRRWVRPRDWYVANMVDNIDRLRNMNNPDSSIASAQALAFARRMDQAIIDGALGDNLTGEDGTTVTPFAAGNIIADGGTKLTIDKLRETRQIMEDNHIDFNRDEVCMVITPALKRSLLEQDEITNNDYNTVRALVDGEVDTFMGFKFLSIADDTEPNGEVLGLPKDAGVRQAFAFAKSGLHFGSWENMSTRLDEIERMHYATQIYSAATFDACRLEEDKLVRIDCLEA
jgi:hypothetical protein